MRKILPIFLIGSILFSSEIKFKADYLRFERKKDTLNAKGNVKVEWEGKFIEADELFVDREKNEFEVRGNVFYKEGVLKIWADRILFNRDGEGRIFNAKVSYDKYFLKAEEIERVSKEEFILEKAYITTCDYPHPHYRLTSKRIFFYPEVKIVAYNMIFKVGKIPLFYFPYWWQSLKKRKWGFRIDIGKSRNQGYFFRSVIYYKITKNLKTSLLLDYFSEIASGGGIEVDYKSKNLKTNFWFYNIKNNRKMTFFLWQKIKRFNIQSNIEYYSSPNFNFNYFWEEKILYPVRVKSRFGISRNTSSSNFLLYYYREQESLNSSFRDVEVVKPGFNFYLFPRKFLFLNYSLKFVGSNRYHYSYGEYEKNLSSILNIYKNFSITGFLSFYPKLSYEYNFYDGNFRSYIFWNPNLRTRILRYYSFDLYQKYKEEIGRGEIYNKIGFSGILRFYKFMSLKNSIELDILNGFKNYRENFTPLLTRFDLRRGKLYLYLRNKYRIYPSRNLESELFYKYGIFGMDIFYYSSYPGKFDVINTLDFRIGKKWKFNLKIRYDILYRDLKTRNIWYKEISFIRDLHCWDMSFKMKERQDKKEFWIFFRIKAFPDKPIGVYYNRKDGRWSLKKK
ncbi:MAG: hypothetical protein DRI36_04415 [Caldiserica bacterium]|nr:MAG: hypothetical protein DRI36_04415 [Caldisericota bacterium]